MYERIKKMLSRRKLWIKIRIGGLHGYIDVKADCMKHVSLLLINAYKTNNGFYRLVKQSIKDYEIFENNEIDSEIACICNGTGEFAGQKCRVVSQESDTIQGKNC